MDTILDWAVVALPTLLSVAAALNELLSKKNKRKWVYGLVVFGLGISILTAWQQQRQRDKAHTQLEDSRALQKTAEEQQKLTQKRLDESVQQQRYQTDLIHDLNTDLRAQDELLQIMKQSLPRKAREKADNIRKHWVRNAYENVGTEDSASAKQP